MEPTLIYTVVIFLGLEGCCFAAAYTNVFRRINTLERTVAALQIGGVPHQQPEVVSAIPVAAPMSVQPTYYAPQMYPPLPRQTGEDPVPVQYVSYYQNRQ
jgi:hypothetical protein